MKPTEEQLKSARDKAYECDTFGEAFEAGVEFMLQEGTYLWAMYESFDRPVCRKSWSDKDRFVSECIVHYIIPNGQWFEDENNLIPEDLNANDWEVCE